MDKKRKDRRSLSRGPSFKDWPGGQTETAADVMRVLDTPQDAFAQSLANSSKRISTVEQWGMEAMNALVLSKPCIRSR